LASALRLAIVRLNRRLRAQRPDREISLTQSSALSTVYKCGPMTPGELPAKEKVRPPSMTRVLANLQERGFVRRREHETDRRQAIVELTEQGTEYLRADISVRERWLDQRLAELTEDERELLSRAAEIIERLAAT
jgi:DNA-binding MarR family transcriptional regulator